MSDSGFAWPPEYLAVDGEAEIITDRDYVVDIVMQVGSIMTNEPVPDEARPTTLVKIGQTPDMENSNRQVISVSELNRDAKRLLESNFPMLWVEGEISNFARPRSGHWYFTLKDDRAQVRCAMFRNRNHLIRFSPKDGQQVIVRGRISLYEGRGEFQMIAEFLEESGEGALRRAFEQLRGSLQLEGLFDESRKKPVPATPRHIAIVTSPQGAAIRDIISVMKRRFPSIHISILPVQVQGDESVPQIVDALSFANRYQDDPFDLILLTRGGGSLEDLWSFNTEPVARAIASSKLPVVAAVGHESDVSIADFVADVRAPTPSAAAELITPDAEVMEDQLRYLERSFTQGVLKQLQDHGRDVSHLQKRLRHPSAHLEDLSQQLDDLEKGLHRSVSANLNKKTAKVAALHLPSPGSMLDAGKAELRHLSGRLQSLEASSRQQKETALASLAAKLDALSPLATLQRGFAIVSTQDSGILTSADLVNPGDKIRARLSNGAFHAEVLSREEE